MTLNLISFFGLFVMIGLAWLMSSHRTKVDWRLVVYGLILQMVFAGIFFDSQNWKFSRTYDSFPSLLESVEDGESLAANVPLTWQEKDKDPTNFATGYEEFKSGTIDRSQWPSST